MHPSENRRSIDWRGWVILAWVVWFGGLYGKMVVEQRGRKIQQMTVNSLSPDTPVFPVP